MCFDWCGSCMHSQWSVALHVLLALCCLKRLLVARLSTHIHAQSFSCMQAMFNDATLVSAALHLAKLPFDP